MSRPLACLGALLLATTACSRPNPEALAGDYVRQHRVFVFHGNEPLEADVEDQLTLTAHDTDSLEFELLLAGNGGQTCEMQGLTRATGDHFQYRDTDSSTRCVLSIRHRENQIILEDLGDHCRRAHCGEFVSIGRLAFGPRRDAE